MGPTHISFPVLISGGYFHHDLQFLFTVFRVKLEASPTRMFAHLPQLIQIYTNERNELISFDRLRSNNKEQNHTDLNRLHYTLTWHASKYNLHRLHQKHKNNKIIRSTPIAQSPLRSSLKALYREKHKIYIRTKAEPSIS